MDKTQNSFQLNSAIMINNNDLNNHHLNTKRQKNFNEDLNLINNSMCTNDSNNKLPNKNKKLKTSPMTANTMFNNNNTNNEIPQQLTQPTSFRFEYPNPLLDQQQQHQQQHLQQRQIEQNQLDFRNNLNYYDEEEEEDDDEDDEDDEEDEDEDEDDDEEEEELDAENGRLPKQKKTKAIKAKKQKKQINSKEVKITDPKITATKTVLKSRNKKTKGRVKIKMEFIENKIRRYTTFSKRKTGIMKKAYELSTLTGTQVMLLVASETGHVYTFATDKLQPMITSDTGKTLIQSCLSYNQDIEPNNDVVAGPSIDISGTNSKNRISIENCFNNDEFQQELLDEEDDENENYDDEDPDEEYNNNNNDFKNKI